jgi:hypothetical protein
VAEQTDSRSTVLLEDEGSQAPRPVAAGKLTWRTVWPARAWLVVATLAGLVFVETMLVRRWLALGISPAAVLVGCAGGAVGLAIVVLATRLLSALTLRYVVTDHTLAVVRGMARWVIPLTVIERVYIGEKAAVQTEGILLPGFLLGKGYLRDGGPALFFSSVSPAGAVAVRTAECTYILSPGNADTFVAVIEQRRAHAQPACGSAPGPGWLAVLRQPPAVVLTLAATAANAALFAYIARWYVVLPDLPVHFSAAGTPDRWGTPAAHFWLPTIGAIILLSDLFLSALPPLRDPLRTYLLLAAAVVVQVCLWVAFVSLLP